MRAPAFTALLLATAVAADAVRPALPRVEVDARLLGTPVQSAVFRDQPRQPGPVFYAPAHRTVVFGTDLYGHGRTSPPAINVYPVAALLAKYPERGPGSVRAQVEALRAINSGRLNPVRAAAGDLPYLWTPGAAQMAVGAVRRLTLPGGLSGVRFLTIHAQEEVRYPREAVLYSFQGLTRDGRFYVTFDAPYAPPNLPAQADLDRTRASAIAPMPAAGTGPAQVEYRAAVAAYFGDLRRRLDANDTAPGVKTFDAVVRSLRLRP